MAKPTNETVKAYDDTKNKLNAAGEAQLLQARRLQESPPMKMRQLPSTVGQLTPDQLKSMYSDENRKNFLGMQQVPGGDFLSIYKDGKGGFVGLKSNQKGALTQQMNVPESLVPDEIKDPLDYETRMRAISETQLDRDPPEPTVNL
jgi:hypothetical protein|tara:strand:+ start:64 stop:501 length:438 start_codon:yes stop_codon:yes gene_type:complete